MTKTEKFWLIVWLFAAAIVFGTLAGAEGTKGGSEEELLTPTFEEVECQMYTKSTCVALLQDALSPFKICRVRATGYVEGVADMTLGWHSNEPPPGTTFGEIWRIWLGRTSANMEFMNPETPAFACVAGTYIKQYGQKEEE